MGCSQAALGPTRWGVSGDIPSVEDMSRPAKAFVDGGKVEHFGDTAAILAATVPTIVAGSDATSFGHQAALLTAVETTARAFDQAPVFLSPEVASAKCSLPGQTEATMAEAVVEAGGHLVDTSVWTLLDGPRSPSEHWWRPEAWCSRSRGTCGSLT